MPRIKMMMMSAVCIVQVMDNEDDDDDSNDKGCAVTAEAGDVDTGTKQLNGLLNESIILLRLVS